MATKEPDKPIQISRGMARVVVVILVLVLVMGAAALISSYWENQHYEKQLSAQIASQQSSQDANRKLILDKLCSTLTGLAEIKAPAGDPATNPSRAFEQAQQKKLAELSSDLGC